MAENTLYRQVSFEDGFDLISNGNDDKFIYLKEVHEQEQSLEDFYSKLASDHPDLLSGEHPLDYHVDYEKLYNYLTKNFILIKKQ